MRNSTIKQVKLAIKADPKWATDVAALEYGDIVAEAFDRTDIYFDNHAGVHQKIVDLFDAHAALAS